MKKSQKFLVFICSVFFLAGLFFNKVMAQQPDSISTVDINFAVGAYLSFLESAEDRGVEFREDGMIKPGLDIFRDHGYDLIRLRLFHSPDGIKQFYDKFNSYNIPYDIIGLSYYAWWHGNLQQLRENLLSPVDNYYKDIIFVETGYRPHEFEKHPAPSLRTSDFVFSDVIANIFDPNIC